MSASLRAEAARLRAGFPSPTSVMTRLGPVEYATYGEGPAVLALHGGMGGYDQSLLLARAAVAGGHKVLAVSRPGYLGTPLGVGPTPEQQADLYAALLDTLGIAKAGVIAVSAGGPGALQFALRHPERCRSLVLVSACTGHLATPPDILRRMSVMQTLARVPFLIGMMGRWARRHPGRAAQRSIADDEIRARTLAHREAGPMLAALSAITVEHLRKRLPGTINDIAQCQAINSYPLERLVPPVLVVHGTGDRVVPFAHGQAVAQTAPHAELLTIAHGEHVCLFTHLDDIRRRVTSFLAPQ